MSWASWAFIIIIIIIIIVVAFIYLFIVILSPYFGRENGLPGGLSTSGEIIRDHVKLHVSHHHITAVKSFVSLYSDTITSWKRGALAMFILKQKKKTCKVTRVYKQHMFNNMSRCPGAASALTESPPALLSFIITHVSNARVTSGDCSSK